jgi:hypothetical protein
MSEMSVPEVLHELEQRLLDSTTRKNAEAVASLLTDDFQEFGSSGRIYSKPEIIAALQAETEVCISMRDFEARFLAENIALITYISTKVEQGSSPVEALRSSIWALRDDRWQMLFHQGTRLPPI